MTCGGSRAVGGRAVGPATTAGPVQSGSTCDDSRQPNKKAAHWAASSFIWRREGPIFRSNQDSDGTLTRDIQKLRANERSALSLAEEYEAMEGEIAAELPRLELELAEVAKDCLSAKNAIASEAAGQAYGQLLEQVVDSLAVAFALFSLAENAGVDNRQSASAEELASRFFVRLGNAVRSRMDDATVTEQVAERLALPPMDMSEVDMQLAGSVAARIRRRVELNAEHTA
ncbi:hypothetical protein [Stenotrophomonas maltophilia]|uniref:hypothetical protein n=1 Tax=Stenotrophomonas maltophilia TaxID=40324 RepID=UPI001F46BF1F|nr:hypothetical protein [Stenotrophomonas maltophilia]MCO7487709.1 hypothetical protein [Stenotrophomonas maltophilia]MCR1535657.1 hypothetical protein [Stenotrophomonas maltophilia]